MSCTNFIDTIFHLHVSGVLWSFLLSSWDFCYCRFVLVIYTPANITHNSVCVCKLVSFLLEINKLITSALNSMSHIIHLFLGELLKHMPTTLIISSPKSWCYCYLFSFTYIEYSLTNQHDFRHLQQIHTKYWTIMTKGLWHSTLSVSPWTYTLNPLLILAQQTHRCVHVTKVKHFSLHDTILYTWALMFVGKSAFLTIPAD